MQKLFFVSDRPMTSRSLRTELSLGGPTSDDLAMAAKKKVRMSSPERFEIKQLIAAGVIDKSELPDFDEESGLLPKVDSDDEDVEVELVEDEAPFLKGHGRMINDLSPVRYTVNPRQNTILRDPNFVNLYFCYLIFLFF